MGVVSNRVVNALYTYHLMELVLNLSAHEPAHERHHYFYGFGGCPLPPGIRVPRGIGRCHRPCAMRAPVRPNLGHPIAASLRKASSTDAAADSATSPPLRKRLSFRDEMRQLCDELLAAYMQQLNAAHTETLAMKLDLANLLCKIGEREAARRLHEEVLAERTRHLGGSHLHTLEVKEDLAIVHKDMNNRREARLLLEEVELERVRQLGAGHTKTLDTKYNLAVLAEARGDLNDAEALYWECADGYARTYGPSHPETDDARRRLIRVLAPHHEHPGYI